MHCRSSFDMQTKDWVVAMQCVALLSVSSHSLTSSLPPSLSFMHKENSLHCPAGTTRASRRRALPSLSPSLLLCGHFPVELVLQQQHFLGCSFSRSPYLIFLYPQSLNSSRERRDEGGSHKHAPPQPSKSYYNQKKAIFHHFTLQKYYKIDKQAGANPWDEISGGGVSSRMDG